MAGLIWLWNQPAGVSLEQTRFRGRNDDGTETTATWKAAESTNWTQLPDTNFRVRFQVNVTGGSDSAGNYQLRYNRNGAGWNNVNASSLVIRSSASPNVADASATTNQLTSPGGTFKGGQFDEGNGLAGTTLTTNQFLEFEYCVQVRSADVVTGDSIQLRVENTVLGALTLYTATPTVTVASAYAAEVLADTPWLYWRLGEPSGTTANDTSGNSRVGTYVNTPTLGATSLVGEADTAATFAAASTEYVERQAAGVTGGTAFSVEMWFKAGLQTSYSKLFMESIRTTNKPIMEIVCNNNAQGIYYHVANDAGTSPVDQLSSVTVFNNVAHHLVLTDADVAGTRTWRLYIDGTQVGTGTYTRGTYSGVNNIAIGASRHSGSTFDPFNGTLDEFALYTTELSSARVTAHYVAGGGSVAVNANVTTPTIARAAVVGNPLEQAGASPVLTGVGRAAVVGNPVEAASAGVALTGVARTATVGVPTRVASASVAPAGVARQAFVGTPTRQAAASVTPAGQARTAVVGVPTRSAGASVTPAAVIGTAVVGSPTVSATTGATNVDITTTAVIGTRTVAAPSVVGNANAPPIAAVASATVGVPTRSASANAARPAIVGTATVGAPTVLAVKNALITTPTIARTATVATLTPQAQARPTPAAAVAGAVVGVPTTRGSASPVLTGIGRVAVVGVPTLSRSANVTRPAIVGIAVLTTPQVEASGADIFVVFLDRPLNLTATPVSPSQIDLDWDAVAGATTYAIERDGVVIVPSHGVTSYSDMGLAAETTYVYRVKAY